MFNLAILNQRDYITGFLHQFDGADGSVPASPDQTGARTVTSSFAEISTTNPNSGTGSLTTDGVETSVQTVTTDYSNALSFSVDDKSFCVEFWVRKNDVDAPVDMVTLYTNSVTPKGMRCRIPSGAGVVDIRTTITDDNGYSKLSQTGNLISIGNWYHIAIVRNGMSFITYVDGAVGDTDTIPALIYDDPDMRLQIDLNKSGLPVTGAVSIDSLRIVIGRPVYTAPFTAPTGPLGLYTE